MIKFDNIIETSIEVMSTQETKELSKKLGDKMIQKEEKDDIFYQVGKMIVIADMSSVNPEE